MGEGEIRQYLAELGAQSEDGSLAVDRAEIVARLQEENAHPRGVLGFVFPLHSVAQPRRPPAVPVSWPLGGVAVEGAGAITSEQKGRKAKLWSHPHNMVV